MKRGLLISGLILLIVVGFVVFGSLRVSTLPLTAGTPSLAQTGSERRVPDLPQATSVTPGYRLLPPQADVVTGGPWAAAAADTTILGEWTFDDGMGGPDPQGWTTLDFTAQIDTFFHVDDFAGLGGGNLGGLVPLSGSRSLWCGTRLSEDPQICFATPPGYGNDWDQSFESVAFSVTGDVTVDFLIRYDSEEGYDDTRVEYLSKSGRWNSLAQYDGRADSLGSVTVPVDSLSGTVRLRFRFGSDGAFSDRDGLYDSDGAVIIDSLTVRDAGGVVDFQDFESEAVGALVTTDGDWMANVRPAYGDYAGLFDGSTVLQEDTLVANNTYFWGFFNGSTVTYACGGHPEQLAVPHRKPFESDYLYIHNGIVSPVLELPALSDTSLIVLEFDVYRDLPLDNLVFYEWRVRSWNDQCATRWRGINMMYYKDYKDWYHAMFPIEDYVQAGADSIQVALIARDMCGYWCGVEGSGMCHSHAPLVDNVRVSVMDFPVFTVTNTNDAGPGSLRQAVEYAKGLGKGQVNFDIPGTGPHTLELTSKLNVTGRVVIDGTTQPGYTGTPLICLHPGGTYTDYALLYLFGGTVVRRLELADTPRRAAAGIQIGNGSIVEGCRIEGFPVGISIQGSDSRIGGTGPGQVNELTSNDFGVVVEEAPYGAYTGNTIRGNRIDDNTGLGIDLYPYGVTVNDSGDVDTGANDLLNYPTLDHVVYGKPGGAGGYLSGTEGEVFTVDFYASPACDPSGYGEGALYLGSTSVTALPGNQDTWFDTGLDSVPLGYVVTATTTDSEGNTSEFCPCNAPSVQLVTNTLDSGDGSLRAAITLANADPDMSIIRFNIPGEGPHTIQPLTRLPVVTAPVIIDGYTQPGASPNTNGDGLGGNAVLKIELDGSALSGPIDRGLEISTGDGSAVRGLVINNFPSIGIFIRSDGNVIEGNYVGTDVTGSLARPNYRGLDLGGRNNIIGGTEPASRNVISGNTTDGISMGWSSSNLIQSNFIGVSASGALGVANNANGVRLTTYADSNVVYKNVVSANALTGVLVSATAGGVGNRIQRNYIGTDVTGTIPLGNGSDGVRISVGSMSGAEITVGGGASYANLIANNGGDGVSITLEAAATLRAAVRNNTIHSNDNGVVVTQGNAIISQNKIFSNAGLGIDLADDGLTANDPVDPDTGPNGLQNFPVLTAVDPESLKVTGTLNSTPSTKIDVEFFSSASCDPSGFGEGAKHIGKTRVTTDAEGNVAFEKTLLDPIPGGYYITATAQPVSGGGTSEFSQCFEVINTPPGTNVSVNPVDEATGETPVDLTFDEVTAAGNTLLEMADTGPAVPGIFIVGDSATYYHLSTTATFNDSILVCLSYDEDEIPGPEEDLVILHYDTTLVSPDWVDITVSLDTLANVVCGRTATLSPFVLAVPNPASGADTDATPTQFALHQSIPNPFNPTTIIGYDVPAGGAHVTIRVYDVTGRLVQTLVDEPRPEGVHRVIWDGRNARGEQVATGVYFYRMQAGSFVATRKAVLLK